MQIVGAYFSEECAVQNQRELELKRIWKLAYHLLVVESLWWW